MKKFIEIVVEPKNTKRMCSDKRKLADDCNICLTEIQSSVDVILNKIEQDFRVQRAKMSDEWVIFLQDSQEKLDKSIVHSERESDQMNSNSRWILGIILGITFSLGAVVGFMWERIGKKADRDEVMTINEIQFLHNLTKAYNAAQFMQNPNAKVDSTNYELIVNAVLGGTMRGD